MTIVAANTGNLLTLTSNANISAAASGIFGGCDCKEISIVGVANLTKLVAGLFSNLDIYMHKVKGRPETLPSSNNTFTR